MTESTPVDKLTLRSRVLCRFRNVYYHRYFQRRPAARALLAGRHAGMFPLQIELCGYRVGAHRTMRQALGVILQ